jgi:hypothetical protein
MVDCARNQMARHERYLHDWGIATGLNMTEVANRDANGNDFADITLGPGVAIDGYGAEVIVPEAAALDYNDFLSQKIVTNDPMAWYPVFINGQEQSSVTNASSSSACGSSQVSKTSLTYSVTFGRPGSESDALAQPAPADVTQGTGPAVDGWLILVGFVQWSVDAGRFKHAAASNGSSTLKYAGVQADSVTARGTSLTLATKNPAVMMVLDTTKGLQFGLQNPDSGAVKAVFTVTPQGNVTANGTIQGQVPSAAQFGSGTVSDGMLLPLPGTITEDQVTSGAITLCAHLTPRYQGSRPAGLPLGDWTMTPLECRVDGRRVYCRVRWSNGAATHDIQGTCDYLVIATPTPKAGS